MTQQTPSFATSGKTSSTQGSSSWIPFGFLALVVVAAHGGLVYHSLQQQEIEKQRLSEERSEQDQETLRFLVDTETQELENYIHQLARDPAVVEAMASGNRAAIDERIRSLEAVSSILPLRQLTFHLPAQPYWSQFGDDTLSDPADGALQPSVAEALATGAVRLGFAAGPQSIGLHVAMPVTRSGRLVGAVEAVADHRPLIKKFIERTGTEAALYVLLPKKDRSDTLKTLAQLGIDTKAVEQESKKDVYALDAASNVNFFEKAAGEYDMADWQDDERGPGTMYIDDKAFICRSLAMKGHDGQNTGFVLWAREQQPAVGAKIDEVQLTAVGLSAGVILACGLLAFAASRKRVAVPTPPAPNGPDRDHRYKALFDQSTDALILFDESGAADANAAALALLGYGERNDLLGSAFLDLSPEYQRDDQASALHYHEIELSLQQGRPVCFEWVLHRADGSETVLEVGMKRFSIGDKELTLASFNDPAERAEAEQRLTEQSEMLDQMARDRDDALQAARTQIMESDRLASVGRLASGIAHEINTPVQCVGDTFHALSDSFKDLTDLLAQYRQLVDLVRTGVATSESAEPVRAVEEKLSVDYLIKDIPRTITEGIDGVQRVASIIRAIKEFAHLDHCDLTEVDLNQLLESTVTVARNEYKYAADLEMDLGEIPPVACYPGEMGQVFLNLLINAAHAIADTQRRGTITVRSRLDGECVEVSVTDTGTGIPEEIRESIFDPFFTTKEPGQGTGQGLFICRQIVVERHGGDLRFESQQGIGTSFVVRLPVAVRQQRQERVLAGAHA